MAKTLKQKIKYFLNCKGIENVPSFLGLNKARSSEWYSIFYDVENLIEESKPITLSNKDCMYEDEIYTNFYKCKKCEKVAIMRSYSFCPK